VTPKTETFEELRDMEQQERQTGLKTSKEQNKQVIVSLNPQKHQKWLERSKQDKYRIPTPVESSRLNNGSSSSSSSGKRCSEARRPVSRYID
jgi:hypothetical protein